jgi:hypothetical protein
MPDIFVSKTEEKALSDRAVLEKLCHKKLTDQEAFETERDLLGAFGWLVEMDRKYNPQFYDNNRD